MTPELQGYVEGLRSRNEPGLKRIADEIEAMGSLVDVAQEYMHEAEDRWLSMRSKPMCGYGCQSPTFMDAALAAGWDGTDKSTFDDHMNKTWLEHVKTCPNHPQRKVEAELAEANSKIARIKHVLISSSRSNRELLISQILGA